MDDSNKIKTELTDKQIVDLVKRFAATGIKKIRITGGEPLVRKNIINLISDIHTIDGIEEIVVTTNGLLLPGRINEFKQAGVKRFNISLNSLQKEKNDWITKSNWDLDYHALIKELIENELFPIKLNVVLLKGINTNEMNDYIELANQYDIEIRFIELMEIGELNIDYKKYFISKDNILQEHKGLHKVSETNTSENYKFENNKGIIGFINPVSKKFCDKCNRVRLTSDGFIKPCLHKNKEIDITVGDQNIIYDSIFNKPKGHNLSDDLGERSSRSMNKNGG